MEATPNDLIQHRQRDSLPKGRRNERAPLTKAFALKTTQGKCSSDVLRRAI